MSFRRCLTLLIALCLTACAEQRPCLAPSALHTDDDDAGERRKALVDAFARNALRSITLEALGCYGTCPSYVVRFFADGHMTFEDKRIGCRETATAYLPFARVTEAARFAGAVFLRRRYDVRAIDTFGARITLTTTKNTFVSDGPDVQGWDPRFLATYSRLDQIVRDTTWSPRISVESCAAGTAGR